MKKLFKYLSIIFIFILLFITSSCSKPSLDNFNKIKVGQNYDKVIKLLGEEEDREEFSDNSSDYIILYWFKGNVKTQEEAQSLYNKFNIATVYYCVILTSYNDNNFTIKAKDDIITGSWGVD